jgi:hypothetical protein
LLTPNIYVQGHVGVVEDVATMASMHIYLAQLAMIDSFSFGTPETHLLKNLCMLLMLAGQR